MMMMVIRYMGPPFVIRVPIKISCFLLHPERKIKVGKEKGKVGIGNQESREAAYSPE